MHGSFARELFRRAGMARSLALVDGAVPDTVSVALLDGVPRIVHDPHLPHCGLVGEFQLDAVGVNQIVLLVDRRQAVMQQLSPESTRFLAELETCQFTGLDCVGKLNIAAQNPRWQSSVVRVNRMSYRHNVREVIRLALLEQHNDTGTTVMLLVGGTSASGKSVLVDELQRGIEDFTMLATKPSVVSLDNYFKNLTDPTYPLTATGEKNCEDVNALRLGVVEDHVRALTRGVEVQQPVFDLGAGSITNSTTRTQPSRVLLIEGIFALHPRIRALCEQYGHITTILAQPLSSLPLDELRRVANDELRLVRCIVRDHGTRHRSAAVTLARWPLVTAGEPTHTFPYVHGVERIVNTAVTHELGALQIVADQLLRRVPRTDATYGRAQHLRSLLAWHAPISNAP